MALDDRSRQLFHCHSHNTQISPQKRNQNSLSEVVIRLVRHCSIYSRTIDVILMHTMKLIDKV